MRRNIAKEIKQYYALWCETNGAYEKWARRYQLSYYELLILISLWENKQPCTQRKICDQWTMPKQTVHSILKNFEKKNWVILKIQEKDHRNKVISLTRAGYEFAKVVMRDLQQHEGMVWEKLGEQRRQDLLENTTLYLKYFIGGEEDENQ